MVCSIPVNQPHPIRVLIADDHPALRKGLSLFLEQPGDIQVVGEAGDGEEALAMIGALMPDVAILDIQMPRLNGIEVTRLVRAHGWPVGVLILSAYDDPGTVAAVVKSGALGYVLKTSNSDEIIAAVMDVYQGKTVLDASSLPKASTMPASARPPQANNLLTDRELEILTEVARGSTNKLIAETFNISDRTVQGHLAHIFDKLQANSRTDAVMRAISLGLINSPEPVGSDSFSYDI